MAISRAPSLCTSFFVVCLTLITTALCGCSCSSGEYSGRYVADMGGGKAVLDFHGSNEVKVSLISSTGEEISHNSVYTVKDDKMFITTDEPMGVPMTVVIEDGKLTDGAGMIFEKQ
jgi:hypothetical protein